MIWIVAYRGEGEKTEQLAISGRAAAIVAAITMIENGIEVLTVTDQRKSKSVSKDEIRQVCELSHTPSIQSMFRMIGREALVESRPFGSPASQFRHGEVTTVEQARELAKLA